MQESKKIMLLILHRPIDIDKGESTVDARA